MYAPLGVKPHFGAASAVVALVIIAVVTPTAPSVARAITKSTVVFWILFDSSLLTIFVKKQSKAISFNHFVGKFLLTIS
jgi:hypothetical protein